MLLALAKPKFSALRINLNSGNIAATSSGVPSVDALSTTITSAPTFWQCSRNEPRHSSTYFWAFHTTMTTDTRVGSAFAGRGSVPDSLIVFDMDMGNSLGIKVVRKSLRAATACGRSVRNADNDSRRQQHCQY